MGIQLDHLNGTFTKFIQNQSLFFVATAAPEGRVNMSPKGLDSLRVINDKEIHWLSLSGSGNETAAHVLANQRMTLMFCAFTGDAQILRVHGNADVVHKRDSEWDELYAQFPDFASARNIFRLKIDLVTTACGSGVPEMEVVRSRGETELDPWYAEMGEDGLEKFWRRKNAESLDGMPTGLFE